MSIITITTTADTVNPNDGATSLREALAQAGNGDTVTFASGLNHQTLQVNSTLSITNSITLDGDLNNDGLADITLDGQHLGTILYVAGGPTIVDVTGLRFVNGGATIAAGANGGNGAAGAVGTDNSGGVDYVDLVNQTGGDGGAGGSGGSPGHVAGAIYNDGFLTLRYVEFANNSVHNGDGGASGSGGEGGRGGNGAGINLSIGIFFGGGGSGVSGGNGGNGGSGGSGGDGGSSGGGIVNFGTLRLGDVAFIGNSAAGGSGTSGSNGGNGGNGGGADSGGSGVFSGGTGGDGGDGGRAGNAGSGGSSGDAAGGILNYAGLETIAGTIAASGNTAQTGTAGHAGAVGTPGTAALGAPGGDGVFKDGSDGDDGTPGDPGAPGVDGHVGTTGGFLANVNGAVGGAETANTIVYLAVDAQNQVEGSGGTATVFHLYVNRIGDLSQVSIVEVGYRFFFGNPDTGFGISTNGFDFVGGLPSAQTFTFAVGEQQKAITITVAGDTQLEGDEQFFVSLDSIDGTARGTSALMMTIINDDDGSPPPSNVAPNITDYEGSAVTFTTYRGPVFIDTSRNASVRDNDSPFLNGGRLTVSISQNKGTGDVLAFAQEPNGISFDSDANVFFDGIQVGVLVNGGGSGVLAVDFTADVTPVIAGKLIAAVTFDNTTVNVSPATRTISVQVTDGDGGTSAVTSGTVQIVIAQARPTLDLDGDDSSGATGTGYLTSTAPGGVAIVDGDVAIGDADGTVIGDVIFRISNHKAGDLLSFAGSVPAGFTVNGYDATFGTFSIFGDGSFEDYQNLLQQVRFSTTSADRTSRDIRIHVFDGNEDSADAHATIVMNNKPTVPGDSNSPTGGSVTEGATAGTTVGITARSTDLDGDAISYVLANNAGGRFAINSSTGVVTVTAAGASSIDHESAPAHAYTISVYATDGIGQGATQDFTIAVGNVAPSAPLDTNGPAGGSVVEGAAAGAAVGITASASDVNGGTITYSLQDNAGGRFAINASGVVTVASAALIDYETATSYTIIVRAEDASGAHDADQTYTIAVTNAAPGAPVDTDGASGGSIFESAVNGAAVGIIAASTDPGGGAVTYSLTNSAGGAFAIDQNGVVTVANDTLVSLQNGPVSRSITVRATGSAGQYSETTFKVAIVNVAPTAPADTDGDTGGTISESAANGDVVGVTAHATDPGGPVGYFLSGDAGGRFAIDLGTGVVTVKNAALLDYESAPGHAYSITVSATDGVLTTSQTFSIGVTNAAPGEPADADSAANAVSEGAANGDGVGLTVAASDILGGNVQYSLLDNAGGRFAINATTGVVTILDATLIDYESATGHAYAITAQASDGELASQHVFSIAVTNVAPVTTGETYSVDEDNTLTVAAPGTLTNDGDVNGGALTAILASGPAHAAAFALNPDGSFSYTPVADYNGGDTFTYRVSDGSASSLDVSVTINVDPVNDAPTVTGSVVLSATAEESGPRLITQAELLGNTSDVDGPRREAVNLEISAGGGSLHNNGDGTWTYTPAPDDDTSVSFTYQVVDGIAVAVNDSATLDITPVNDAPTGSPSGPTTASQTAREQIAVSIDPAITVVDIDNATLPSGSVTITGHYRAGEDVLAFVNTDGAVFGDIAGVFAAGTGVLALMSASSTATLAQWQAALRTVTYLNASDAPDSADRTITFALNDGIATGTIATATVSVVAVNDAPIAHGDTAQVDEHATVIGVAPGVLANDTDVDAGATRTVAAANGNTAAVGVAITGTYGTLTLDANGGYSYVADQLAADQLGAGATATDTFSYTVSDGTASDTADLAITIMGVNDAPVAGLPAKLAPIGVNSGARLITQAELLLNATDVDGPTLAAVNLQIATGAGTLVDNHDGSWTYTPKINDDTQVDFSFQITDGIAAPLASATLDLVSAQASPAVGSVGDNVFTAVTGNSVYDGGQGTDTIIFDFKLIDATVTYSGNRIIIDGPTSHTVLTGIELFKFSDGTVDNNDGNWLVDDLFYYSQNHDVWLAHVDADAHYRDYGWREGRDPDAFFSTGFYLAVNPDVRATGVNPLDHYAAFGWQEGRVPSLAFDPAAYLAQNQDVAAAQVDPLLHFLVAGAGEGRQPITPERLTTANGFDYVHYLQNNPDVAAAGVDPLWHYEKIGWTEGRDPNAWFDVKGYLSTYTDVAAAGVNPLDHYDVFGWREGRDPSVDFDTTKYLAANPDVKAAQINPLEHFLLHGIAEHRSAQADGVWG